MLAHSCYFSPARQFADSHPEAGRCLQEVPSGPRGHPPLRVGTLNPDLDRPVNDRDFDVALHILFDIQGVSRRLPGCSRCTRSSSTRTSATGTPVRIFDADVESK